MEAPSWRMHGVAAEKRPLKTKTGETWAYSVRVMAMGGTFEATTKDVGLFDRVQLNQPLVFGGGFDSHAGNMKLILQTVAAK